MTRDEGFEQPLCTMVTTGPITFFQRLYAFYQLFFGGTGVYTQDLTLARQVFYCLSHSTSPFLYWVFPR
jgi:hypothetical protein